MSVACGEVIHTRTATPERQRNSRHIMNGTIIAVILAVVCIALWVLIPPPR